MRNAKTRVSRWEFRWDATREAVELDKTMGTMHMISGKVIAVCDEKGFGFIRPQTEDGDLFFHYSSVEGGFDGLQVGEIVDYEPDKEAQRPRAKFVKRLRKRAAAPAGQVGPQSESRPVDPRGSERERTELGFITRLRPRQRLGFISADAGGPELLFGREHVTGVRPFARLAVGDSVKFVRVQDAGEPGPPLASAVQFHERKPKKFELELPNNPKARRKKPTWR